MKARDMRLDSWQDREIYLLYAVPTFTVYPLPPNSPVLCASGAYSQGNSGRRVKPTTYFLLVPTSILHSRISLYDRAIIKGKSNLKSCFTLNCLSNRSVEYSNCVVCRFIALRLQEFSTVGPEVSQLVTGTAVR